MQVPLDALSGNTFSLCREPVKGARARLADAGMQRLINVSTDWNEQVALAEDIAYTAVRTGALYAVIDNDLPASFLHALARIMATYAIRVFELDATGTVGRAVLSDEELEDELLRGVTDLHSRVVALTDRVAA